MIDDMVMRDVYLTHEQNDQLGDLVQKLKSQGKSVSRADLLRAAIASCLNEGYFNTGHYYADARFQGYEGQTDASGNEIRSDRLVHPGLAATLSRSVPRRQRKANTLTA